MIRSTIRGIAHGITFERFAIALTGLGVAFLYALVAGDRLPRDAVSSAVAPPPAREFAAAPRAPMKPIQVAMVGSAEKLFQLIDYRLDGVREHGRVPRVFLASLPRRLPEIRVPAKRKVMFIKTALPLILHVNELIQLDRRRIEELFAKSAEGSPLEPDERAWLEAVSERYGIEGLDFVALLRRVDVIPPSLALAQSAEESGWGTSRFAREGNALFGQRTFRGKKGLVPKGREKGKTHKVRAFDQLMDGVKSYAFNLNTHAAYTRFRKARERVRLRGAQLDGYTLAGTLKAYSERGAAYVKSIRTIIRVNGLTLYDKARLGKRLSVGLSGPDA